MTVQKSFGPPIGRGGTDIVWSFDIFTVDLRHLVSISLPSQDTPSSPPPTPRRHPFGFMSGNTP
ncbi:hypothetical protein EYF80_037280 [Liparis tanakae]|uniref:Uncharacterized protein n=1 Tax=Liparis tanakae TaxID=230148 RepID=A0A4Z2GHX5_9TELE|nr:hypothetical protein EYF80_037280 [Liparis tanakae]